MRGTGTISLTAPPVQGVSESSSAYAQRLNDWYEPQYGETSAETSARRDAQFDTARVYQETDDAWAARVDAYYRGATVAVRRWIDYMRSIGRLPRAPYVPPPANTTTPGVTLLTDDQIALTNTVRRTGESDANWRTRVEMFYRGANAAQRAWIDHARASGQLPSNTPAVGSSNTTVRPASGGGVDPQTALNIATGVTSALQVAGSTVLALVREANAADAQARHDAAQAESDRIARQETRDGQISAAVTAAVGANFDADNARRLLVGGDRAGAIATLSTGQGKLAAAAGAQAVLGTNATLNNALAAATSALGAVARQIDVTAPPATPAVSADSLSTALALAQLQRQSETTTPWYKTPFAIGAAVVLGIGVVAVARRRKGG